MNLIRTETGSTEVRSRRGTLMAEVLITAGISSVMMGLAILAIHHLLKAQDTHRDAVRNGLAQQRLITLFRRDCREAESAEPTDKGIRLRYADSREVTYGVKDHAVIRSWKGDGSGTDEFYSTRRWTCRIEIPTASSARLVLEQAAGGSKRTLPGKTRRIVTDAIVGRHARLATSLTIETTEEAKQ